MENEENKESKKLTKNDTFLYKNDNFCVVP